MDFFFNFLKNLDKNLSNSIHVSDVGDVGDIFHIEFLNTVRVNSKCTCIGFCGAPLGLDIYEDEKCVRMKCIIFRNICTKICKEGNSKPTRRLNYQCFG